MEEWNDEDIKSEILEGVLDKYNTSEILNWMAAEGVIDKGQYLVSIVW